MANNRMYLVHVPTGLAVFLGKRMGYGWYTTKEERIGPLVQKLFDVLDQEHVERQDDFAVAMEDIGGATLAFACWRYGNDRDDGLTQLLSTLEMTS